jgi:ubiquitin carboxyl-terminal hydrolase 7
MSIEEAWNRYGSKGAPFRLWAETCEKSEDGKPTWPEPSPTNPGNVPILVFLKYFDVKAQTLTGVGHVYVRRYGKVGDIVGQILDVMKWEPGLAFLLFEEIKHSMIEPMKSKQTFQQSEIQDGDIICFQKILSEPELSTVTYTDARQYYDYLLNRISIEFLCRSKDGGPSFSLMLSKKMTYEQFSAKVGEYLKVDPTHIRYATVHVTTNKPKLFVKRALSQTLQQILSAQYTSYGYTNHRNDALYYEVLETSLADYETKKIVKVTWLSEGITKEVRRPCLFALSMIYTNICFRNSLMCSWPKMGSSLISFLVFNGSSISMRRPLNLSGSTKSMLGRFTKSSQKTRTSPG